MESRKQREKHSEFPQDLREPSLGNALQLCKFGLLTPNSSQICSILRGEFRHPKRKNDAKSHETERHEVEILSCVGLKPGEEKNQLKTFQSCEFCFFIFKFQWILFTCRQHQNEMKAGLEMISSKGCLRIKISKDLQLPPVPG